MGTTTGLDGEDARGGEGFVTDEEFLIFAGEDIVGDSSYHGRKQISDRYKV